MSQGPMSSSPSKGGTMRSQMPTSYQSPFGNQNYRTQTSPSKGGQPSFGGSAYQQPGQFGGQIMNRPMPSPGGKGGSYQRQPTPFGYGQSTFNPGQFGGYVVPSNAFSFNNPNYQPYMPPTYESGQTGQSPYRGDDPRTSQPEVYDSENFRVLDPYGPGGALEGQPRSTFPDPTQPQGPQGTIQSAPVIDINNQALRDDLMSAAQSRHALEQLRNPDVPTSGRGYSQQTTGDMNSGLGSMFNRQQLAQDSQGAAGGPRLVPSSGPANPYAMGGSRSGQINQQQVEQDRAAYAMSQGGNRRINPPPQNMR